MLDGMCAIHIKLHVWKRPCTGADCDAQTANSHATSNGHRDGHGYGDGDKYRHRKRNRDGNRYSDATSAAADWHGHPGAGADGNTQAAHIDVYGRTAAAARRYSHASVPADIELDQYRATLRPE